MPEPGTQSERGCGANIKWIVLGCIAVLFSLAAFAVVVFALVTTFMRSSEPYAKAMELAQKDPRVIAALGKPIESGWFHTGNIEVSDKSGNADLTISIHGPKEKAKIHVVGEKTDGFWTYSIMTVTTDAGQTIDLLRS